MRKTFNSDSARNEAKKLKLKLSDIIPSRSDGKITVNDVKLTARKLGLGSRRSQRVTSVKKQTSPRSVRLQKTTVPGWVSAPEGYLERHTRRT